MSFRVVVTRTARMQIAAERRRWLEQHPVTRLDKELSDAIARLATNPEAGPVDPRYADARRILLGRTPFHLYYAIDHGTKTVRIHALWHTSRGSGPRL